MLKNLKNKKKKRGFTLIELIIVIAIIAILAVLAIPKFGEIKKDANFKSDIANAKTIANAATTLLADGKKIFVGSDTQALIDDTRTAGNPIEEYLQNPPKPKSNDYSVYKVTLDSDNNVIVVMTKVADGTGDFTNLFPVPATEVK